MDRRSHRQVSQVALDFPAPSEDHHRAQGSVTGAEVSGVLDSTLANGATPIREAIGAFLLSRRVGNCSEATLKIYTANLARFHKGIGTTSRPDITPLPVHQYLSGLRDSMKPVSVHQHFRVLRTFFNWAIEAGVLGKNPMRGITMRAPRALPRVPEDETVRRLLGACIETWEGRRNKALIAVLADSGLRISEAMRVRVEDLNFGTRTIAVRGGKGGKDGVAFFGAETAHLLRAWLAIRKDVTSEDFLFTDYTGRPLSSSHGTHILHRLSVRAGLTRKIGPHALRHYAATAILKQTGDLELVRQVLRHESLTMALRYAHLARPDILRKFKRASPMDNLRAGR